MADRVDSLVLDARYGDVIQHFGRYFELLNSLSGRYYKWSNPRARKAHTCEFGCPIEPGEYYFRKVVGPERRDDPKLCRTCMTKLLYLLLVMDPDMTKMALTREKEAWEATLKALAAVQNRESK